MNGKIRSIVTLGLALAASSVASAAFSVPDLHSASNLAVADVLKNNPSHGDHLTGYKTWKSGEDAKVKVYVDHSGMAMEFNFLCHKHDTGVECHAQ